MRLRFLALLLLCGVSWGSTQSLGKIAMSTGYATFGVLLVQLLVSVVALGALQLLRRRPLPLSPAAFRFGLIVALVGTLIPGITFYTSVTRLPAGIMSIIIAAVPMISFPIALMLGIDRFSLLRLAGLFLGIAGVALIALPGASLPEPGMAAFLPVALIGPLCYAIEGNYVARNGTAGMDAVQALWLASTIGALILLPVVIWRGDWVPLSGPYDRAFGALMLESLIHAVIYPVYVWLAARAGSVFASQTSYIVTGTGVFWAMLLLQERFPAAVWAAVALMLAGVALVRPRDSQGVPA